MSAQIDSNPSLIIPDNQPLIFTISDTGTAPERYIVQVEEDGTEIAKLYLTPNTNDKAHFDLSEVARDRVKVDDKIRDESETIHAHDTTAFTTGRNGLKKYEVKVGSYDNGSETTDEDSALVYLLDGAEQISSGLHPSFSEYYPASGSTRKGWLTDIEPVNNKLVMHATEDDEGVVAFLNDSTIISSAAVFIVYRIFNDAGTQLGQHIYLLGQNGSQSPSATDINQKLTYMGIMPKNLNGYLPTGQPSANPTWSYYEFELWSSQQAVTDAVRVYRTCGAVKHENTQLAWTNSRGGWEYLLFTGRTEHTDQVSSKPFKKQLGDWDASTYTFLPEARESQAYQITASTKYKLMRVDFSFAEIELLKYAFRSDNVFIRQGTSGLWQPVTIDTKSYNVKEAFSGIFSVSVDVTLAQDVKC